MNLDHYRNFVAIVDAGTISAASKELLIAQPALSSQLKALEELFGATLVIRNPRHIELTEAGKILYDKVKAMGYLEDAAKREITACVEGERGTLWLAITPANPDPEMERILLDFHYAYPGVKLEIYERNSNNIPELLETGLVEVGLLRGTQALPGYLRSVLTIQEQVMVYYHKDHPVLSPSMKQIKLAQLANIPLSTSRGLQQSIITMFENKGYLANLVNVTSSRHLSKLWAADRKTVALIVANAPFDEDKFCCRPLLGNILQRQRTFVVNRECNLSAIANNFLMFCRQHPVMKDWLMSPYQ